VCTDVGSCRELVYGAERADDADRALGAAGRIVGIADPQALAAAALDLLNDTAQWQAASAAAIRRVERFYTQERMVAAYREIYQAALAANGD
jgi:glycosyltransferase involved in cell wall biosynthesis